MKKRDYITNQLKRTFNKKYENYCITRIYHLLNRDDVQIITQQLFRRKEDGKIALADLYFPQINLYVEINEAYHRNQTEADDKRSLAMKKYKALRDERLKALGEVVFYPLDRIDIEADKSLEEINLQIDDAVRKIRTKIEDMGDKFVPWTGEYKKPEDYVGLGVINCRDNVRLRTIQEVSDLFNKNYKGTQHCWFKTNSDIEYVWCPKLNIEGSDVKNERYQNEISIDGKYIYETENGNPEFYSHDHSAKDKYRITFPYYKDESGDRMYKFKGLFVFNRELSDKYKKAVWEKISEEVDLSKY